MRKRNKNRLANICEPIAVYVMTPNGIELPRGTSEAHAWRDLQDIGRSLSVPPERNETLQRYAARLRALLSTLDRTQRINGAAVFALQHIANLYCNHKERV